MRRRLSSRQGRGRLTGLVTASLIGLLSVGIVAPASAVVDEDCFACFWETCDPAGGRHWDDGTTGSKSGTKHTSCKSGDCHGSCGESLASAAIDEVLSAYDALNLEKLGRLLATHREHVYLNVERQVIQLDGCNGELQASLPLPATTFAALVERTTSVHLVSSLGVLVP